MAEFRGMTEHSITPGTTDCPGRPQGHELRRQVRKNAKSFSDRLICIRCAGIPYDWQHYSDRSRKTPLGWPEEFDEDGVTKRASVG